MRWLSYILISISSSHKKYFKTLARKVYYSPLPIWAIWDITSISEASVVLRLMANVPRKEARLVQFPPTLLCDLLLPIYHCVVTFIVNSFKLACLCGASAEYTVL